jgi:septum formation protein
MQQQLILASASPRRHRILAGLGVAFDVAISAVNEVCIEDDPRATARENARRKMAWTRERQPDAWIIAADTVIDFGGQVVSKPVTTGEAGEMLRAFSGKTHDVLTGVALGVPGEEAEVRVVVSTVRFRPLDEQAIARYFAMVNPLDKAGAYDIDQCPDTIIASFSGSRTNIMGLPVEVVREWLENQGFGVRAG